MFKHVTQYFLFNFNTSPDRKKYFDQDKTICTRFCQIRIMKVIVEIFLIQFQESLKSVSPGNAGIFQCEIDSVTKFGLQGGWLTFQQSKCNYRHNQLLVKAVIVISTLAFNGSSKTAIQVLDG